MPRDSTHPMHLPKSTVHNESARRGCVQIQSAGRLSADCWVCLASEFVLGLDRLELNVLLPAVPIYDCHSFPKGAAPLQTILY
jgi:hypothetical protein